MAFQAQTRLSPVQLYDSDVRRTVAACGSMQTDSQCGGQASHAVPCLESITSQTLVSDM